ncbi:YwiB family protein [Oceanobacillus sp. CAU 1775]
MVQPKSQVSIRLKMKIVDAGETEKNEVKAVGIFQQRNNLAALTYSEEIDGYGEANTFITMQQEKVSIKRTGVVTMQQNFRLNQLTENVYRHPHGNILMETFTDEIHYSPPTKADAGRLEMNYTVKLNGEDERKHTLELEFVEEDSK